jgi:hypothetical protein
MGSSNRREHNRVAIRHNGAIVPDGRVICECGVRDVSEKGARLCLDGEPEIPESFTLVLSRDGGVRRLCRKVWAAKEEIGVTFCPVVSDQPKATGR